MLLLLILHMTLFLFNHLFCQLIDLFIQNLFSFCETTTQAKNRNSRKPYIYLNHPPQLPPFHFSDANTILCVCVCVTFILSSEVLSSGLLQKLVSWGFVVLIIASSRYKA